MRNQQVVHVVGVLFFLAQDVLDHGLGARIIVAEIADQLTVVIDRDPLRDQVLLDHVHEVRALDVLRR